MARRSLALPLTIVGSATLLSRLTGFFRDVLIAALLGTGLVAEAYIAAFLIPNLIRRMMSEGAFNAAFVPRLARLEQSAGPKATQSFAEDVIGLMLAVAILIVVIAELYMTDLLGFLVHGFADDPARLALAVEYGKIAFPFVGFTLISAVFASLLNSSERYALAALVPVLLNILLILVMLLLLVSPRLTQRETGTLLALTVLLAGFIQCLLLWRAVMKAGFRLVPALTRIVQARFDRGALAMMGYALPGMVLAGSGHVHLMLASLLASFEARGLSTLYYADRLFQLPLGFVAAAIGVVLLPRLSHALARDDHGEMADARSESLVFAALIILPASTGLFLLAEPIVSLLFQRAAFSVGDVMETAASLRLLALALPAFVLVKLSLPDFLAREVFRAPLLALFAGLLANFGGAWLARHHGLTAYAASGVMFGAWVNAAILLVFSRGQGALSVGTIGRLIGACAATALMGLGIFGAATVFTSALGASSSIFVRMVTLFAMISCAVVCQLGFALLLRVISWRSIRARLARHRSE